MTLRLWLVTLHDGALRVLQSECCKASALALQQQQSQQSSACAGGHACLSLPADAGISADGLTPGFWQLPQPAADNHRTRLPAAVVDQLQDKLLPLVVGLYRCDRLSATLQQYKANVGDEVKSAVRDVVQQVLPVLLAASGDVASGGLQQQYGDAQLADQLQVRLEEGHLSAAAALPTHVPCRFSVTVSCCAGWCVLDTVSLSGAVVEGTCLH